MTTATVDAERKARQDAAKRLLALRAAEDSFLGFVKLLHPDWKIPKFQLDLIDKLDNLGKRTLHHHIGHQREGRKPIRNMLVTMPPRHAKSTFSTVYFPAWFMGMDPRRFIMSSSYNAGLAADFGRQVRDIFTNQDVQQAFPDARIAQDARANDVWRTEGGGSYFGIGIGGTTTGRPANLLIIDDPIKAREEAESMTMRNKVWDFYTSGLSTRLQPEASGEEPLQLVILTRWHPDDLAGRLQQTEDWKEGRWLHVNYAAIQERKSITSRSNLDHSDPRYLPNDKLQRTVLKHLRDVEIVEERALWPDRFSLEELKRRQRLNPRDFASLYQQQPFIEGGNILKTNWWRYYGEDTDDLMPTNFQSLIIAADTAFKKEETSDFSVAVVAGLTHDGDMYILDLVRGRWDFPELRQRLVSLNAQWRGKGLRACYIEDKASGQSLIQELRRESGIAVIPYKVSRDKVSRANSITPLIEGGRVFLPKTAKWLDEFINETTAFPASAHDDQVDAFTMAIDILSRQSISPESLFGQLDASNSLAQQFSRDPKSKTQFHRWGE